MKKSVFRLVFLQPLYPTQIGQMLDREIFKFSLETVTVRAGTHHSNHDRMIILQPSVAHHRILFIIKRIEYFHSVQSAYCLYPYEWYGFV